MTCADDVSRGKLKISLPAQGFDNINNISKSGLNDIPYLNYLPEHIAQIYRAQYGEAMLVRVRLGTNMAAGNERNIWHSLPL